MTTNAANGPGQPSLNDLVAGEIRAELARRRMSGRRLALALGETQVWTSRRLSGQVTMRLDDIERIAEVLRVPAWQLLAAAKTAQYGDGITLRMTQPTLTKAPLSVTRRGLWLVPSPKAVSGVYRDAGRDATAGVPRLVA